MKKIKLASGIFALVDNSDYEFVNKYQWSLSGYGYARAVIYGEKGRDKNGRLIQKTIKMHRLIIGAKENEFVDHKNRNPLDNRRSNLRICTMSQNSSNVGIRSNNKSGYKGVIEMVGKEHESRKKKWLSYINVDGKRIYGGYFFTKEEAAEKYNEMAKKYHKEFAVLNVIK
jgi:hypothetical protein